MNAAKLDELAALTEAIWDGGWHNADYLRAFIDNDDERVFPAEDAAYIAALDPSTVRDLIEAARLGVAWAAAEAALPEGWRFELQRLDFDGPWNCFAKSRAFWEDDYTVANRDDQHADGDGDTPGAALQALAATLRERSA